MDNPLKLLSTPTKIDKALGELLTSSKSVDLAIAFLGQDAPEMLSQGKNMRIVCWLDSGATCPAAVAKLQETAEVRHVSGMHAKVVIGYGNKKPRRAIVGSANLSRAALGRDTQDAQGRYEVGVVTEHPDTLAGLQGWFEQLWNDPLTRVVDSAALKKAQAAWDRRRKENHGTSPEGEAKPKIPLALTKHPALFEAALEWARATPLVEAIGVEAVELASKLDPDTMTKADLEELLGQLQIWYPDIGVVRRSLKEPLSKVRGSFKRMTDTDQSVVDRLRRELNAKEAKLKGLAVAIWTTILYWRDPDNTPPLNQRSYAVAKELNRDGDFASIASAVTYERWLQLAEELRQAWSLPTLGHVDRVVYAYTEGVAGNWPRPMGPGGP